MCPETCLGLRLVGDRKALCPEPCALCGPCPIVGAQVENRKEGIVPRTLPSLDCALCGPCPIVGAQVENRKRKAFVWELWVISQGEGGRRHCAKRILPFLSIVGVRVRTEKAKGSMRQTWPSAECVV